MTIMVERQEEDDAFGVQRPVYFVSEVLSESKVRYSTIQNLLYAILITSRKFRHYFDAYNISVVTDFPLVDIRHNRDATRCISKWAVELGALTLDFKPEQPSRAGTSRFHGRMVRKPSGSPSQPARALGNVL
jgi:hypothetical protein